MNSIHIIWDWNGTLLNDVPVSLFAVNAAISELGIQPISMETYKKLYQVPVVKFYERILQRSPTDYEWEVIGNVFNKHYIPMVKKAIVLKNAISILESRQNVGFGQSLCSLMEYDDLMESVRFNKTEMYFRHISGRQVPYLENGKEKQLIRHIDELNIPPEKCVVIGDAVDDAIAAHAAGAKAVLYSGGTHCERNLRAIGVPVVSSLEEALVISDRLI